MPTRYNRPHVDISRRFIRRDFQAPQLDRSGSGTPRARFDHATRLRRELAEAFRAFDGSRPTHERVAPSDGAFLEIELVRGTPVEQLERKRDHIQPGATKFAANEARMVGLYVPNAARPVLDRILQDYATGPLTDGGHPRNYALVDSIEVIRKARFETFWTDDLAKIPDNPREAIWWEVWCVRSAEQEFDALADRLGVRIGGRDRRLYFPESVVVPAFTDRLTIELMLFARFAITELRRASDSPVFFLDADREEQIGWTNQLAERVIWPGADAPAVCLLDTGVNRAHSLIEPALAPDELDAADPAWGVHDTGGGHGTGMAGLALHGDLTPYLASMDERPLMHRLESVKLLPPQGFAPTDERFYGAVTQAAIAIPEIRRPTRPRVYCLAVTNDNVSGERPSTWSAALDQAAAGAMVGDEDAPRRLIIVSTGNAPNEIARDRLRSADELPIEDPAQAWNAVTVGGYTDKIDIREAELAGYTPFAAAGDLSPHARTSRPWSGKSAFKPDVVMEAGNRAVSPSGSDVLDADSLGLLSSGSDTDRQPLVPFRATSAATAEAARIAVRLTAAHSDYWPETIRALMIHGAEWTERMIAAFNSADGRRDAASLLRRYGYGVPDFDRANASTRNHLALVSQAEIQPYQSRGGRRSFKDCHFYPLPWPREALETLGDREISLKITLSYFIEPSPGFSASIDPYRYQSFGLRFDLKRRNESPRDFVQRVNALEIAEGAARPPAVTDGDSWMFGPKSISAGSLHCDIWKGPAVGLLTRGMICVYPVGGWWRNRADIAICNKRTRYSLIVSLKSPDQTIDLLTPIEAIVERNVGIDIAFA